MRTFTFALCSLAATLVSAQAPIGSLDRLPDPRTMPVPKLVTQQPKVQTFTLPNGLRVVFLENHELPLMTLSLQVRAGSLEDSADKAGLASLTATLLRTGGTKTLTAAQLDETLESLAATVEFSGGLEASNGYVHCFKKDAPKVVGLLAEMLQAPRFAEDRITFERNQTLSNLKQEEDNPIQVRVKGLFKQVFHGKTFGLKPTEQTVKAITPEDLKGFVTRHYVPGNMVVGLSGDLTLAEAKDLLKQTLGALPKGSAAASTRKAEPASALPGVSFQAKAGLTQSVVLAAYQDFRDSDPDMLALKAGLQVLGEGGMGNRLFNTIRTKHGLAYHAGCQSVFPSTVDGFFLGIALTKAESTVQAASLMKEECLKLKSEGITAEEFENAKRALLNQQVFATANPRQVVAEAANFTLTGKPLDWRQRQTAKLETLTLTQVNDALKRRFQPENLRFYILGDPKAVDAKALETVGKVSIMK